MRSRYGPSLLPVFLLLLAALVVFLPAWKQDLRLDRWLTPRSTVAVVAPRVKVWIDKRTGLYHCPASALYQKSGPGFLLSQGEALKKGYRPAERACR